MEELGARALFLRRPGVPRGEQSEVVRHASCVSHALVSLSVLPLAPVPRASHASSALQTLTLTCGSADTSVRRRQGALLEVEEWEGWRWESLHTPFKNAGAEAGVKVNVEARREALAEPTFCHISSGAH